MENKIYANFRMRDSKGRRVSIFAQEFQDKVLRIFVLTCSKKDQFVKSIARKAYLSWLEGEKIDINPLVLDIAIHEHDGPVFTFNEWCKKNYKKVHENHISIVGSQIIDIHREPVKWNYSKLIIKTLL